MVSCDSITILEKLQKYFQQTKVYRNTQTCGSLYCKKGNLQTAEGKLQLTQRQCSVLQSLLLLFSDYELLKRYF